MSDTPMVLPMASNEAVPPVFQHVAIVGLGLIGGSIALAARQRWPSALVIGVDRGPVLEQAVTRHAVDVAAEDLMIASEADLVILAAPVRANVEILAALPRYLHGQTVVTDVGSTKRATVDAAAGLPPRLRFVGGHPLAGAARGGIEFARADLFERRPWLLVPGEAAGEEVARLTAFVEGLGARPMTLDSAAAHDHLLAFLSHLPQLAASALMKAIGEGAGEETLALAGKGLLDTTRLASSPASIWRDICATNGDEIGAALDALIATLTDLRQGLDSAEAVDAVFAPAAAWRERLVRATGGQ
jgi:prephenate dehydrogenase